MIAAVTQQQRQVAEPDSITGLYAWWRVDDEGLSDGATITTLTDRSGNGYTLTASGAPTYEADELDGFAIARLDGVDDYFRAATASDWTFLHDGSDWAVIAVMKPRTIDPNKLCAIIDTTTNGSSTSRGVLFFIDDRTVVSRNNRLQLLVMRGVNGQPTVDFGSKDEQVPGGRWHVFHARHDAGITGDDYTFGLDSSLGETYGDEPNFAHSASAPTGTFTVCAAASGSAFFCDADLAELIVYNAAISDADLETLHRYIEARYPSIPAPTLDIANEVTILNNSLHNAFPGFCVAPNGDYLAAYRESTNHGGGFGDILVRASSDKGATWGSPITVIAGTNPTDRRDAGLLTTSAGTIICVNDFLTSAAKVANAVQVHRSSDNGATWGSSITVTDDFSGFTVCGGSIIQLANGDILVPVWGEDTGDSHWSAAVCRSTDDGLTWSALSRVADGPTDSRNYNEIGVGQLPDGTVVAVVRDETNNTWWCATSADNGATWTTLVPAFQTSGGGDINILGAPKFDTYRGVLVGVARDTLVTGSPARIVSTHNGTDWQYGDLLDTVGSGQMTYGQVRSVNGKLAVVYSYETAVNGSNSDVFFVPPSA